MRTNTWIPLSSQQEICKQRWEFGKRSRRKWWAGYEQLCCLDLLQPWCGEGHIWPPPSPHLPCPPLPVRIPCPFCYVANRLWPSVEVVSWHLISPLPGQMASEITEGDRMSCPVCLQPVTCTSLWKCWANDKGEPLEGLQAHLVLSWETAFCLCCSCLWCHCQAGLWRAWSSVIACICLLCSLCFDLSYKTEGHSPAFEECTHLFISSIII